MIEKMVGNKTSEEN